MLSEIGEFPRSKSIEHEGSSLGVLKKQKPHLSNQDRQGSYVPLRMTMTKISPLFRGERSVRPQTVLQNTKSWGKWQEKLRRDARLSVKGLHIATRWKKN